MQVFEKLIDKELIEQNLVKIFAYRNIWTLRADSIGDIPFYSLGAAAYMDSGEQGRDFYKQQFLKTNPILKENFSELYEIIFAKLKTEFQKEFVLYDNAAFPGFHIFLTDEVFEIALASRHIDLQYKIIEWQENEIDPNKSLSFTLYLKLPKNGGGVYYWDLFKEDLDAYNLTKKEEIIHQHERKLKLFQEGDLFVHNGHQYHQIAPFFDIEENDQRISLQGHAIYAKNLDKYLVHW